MEFNNEELEYICKALISYIRRKRRDLAHRHRGFGDNPTAEELENLKCRYQRIDRCEELRSKILDFLREKRKK